ncbi:sugar ABC transporter substrate-binding protein [Lederbergia sp. NSJ-179]|uniref:ABC transporter substrate-binding protein n=1 Tax=Lederbergia sp. NSJ-179 TaxID=2931402 RepID=UPI001FD1DD00|nr:sugar ABC transporter substrate-binding protein [Lederbergia sp. NSJ-179]MCJ7842097.1 sugar ABC transporter substrate-binding protein [Lederbergia sp. NSJ-179]
MCFRRLFFSCVVVMLVTGCNPNTIINDDEITNEITVWAWNLEADYLNDLVPAFEEQYPEVEVNIVKLSAEQVYQRLTTGLASGEGTQLPDLVQVEEQRLPLYLDNFHESFVNLSDMGFDQYRDEFVETKIASLLNEEDGIMAFPRDIAPMGTFYRKDIFEEAGINMDEIDTWDDYLRAGIQLREKTGTYLFGIPFNDDAGIFKGMLEQQDSFYFDMKGNVAADTEEAHRSLEMLKKMDESGVTLRASTISEIQAAMKNNAVASVTGGVWWKGVIEEQMPEQEGNWGVIPMPAFKKGGSNAANNGGANLAIPSASNNKEAAYLFGEFASANVDNLLHGLSTYGLYPSMIEAIEAPEMQEEIDFFGGQEIFKVFNEQLENLPVNNFTSDYMRAEKHFNDAVGRVILQNMEVDEALKTAGNRLKASTGRSASNE